LVVTVQFTTRERGFEVALSRRNVLVAAGIFLAIVVAVLVAVYAGGGSGASGGGY
jgi:hypothetical protein